MLCGPTSSMSSVAAERLTRCASTNEKARTPNPMTMAVRIRDCGTGSATDQCKALAPSGMSGGLPRVSPAAVKIRTSDPLASRLSPTMSSARRRLSIRYRPVA